MRFMNIWSIGRAAAELHCGIAEFQRAADALGKSAAMKIDGVDYFSHLDVDDIGRRVNETRKREASNA